MLRTAHCALPAAVAVDVPVQHQGGSATPAFETADDAECVPAGDFDAREVLRTLQLRQRQRPQSVSSPMP